MYVLPSDLNRYSPDIHVLPNRRHPARGRGGAKTRSMPAAQPQPSAAATAATDSRPPPQQLLLPQPSAAAAAATNAQPPHVTSETENFAHSSAPGCHIAGTGSDPSSAWVLSRRRFSRRSLGLRKADAVPDISLEPQSKTLTFLNPSDGAKAFFVSVIHHCTARHGPLAAGASRDAQGQKTPVTTLVVTVQPRQIVEVCTVEVRRPAVHVRLQPRLPTVTASIAYGCSLDCLPIAYGCRCAGHATCNSSRTS